jgi:sugar phosphate isomerase/epimerase
MAVAPIELVASYWTLAGNVMPGGPTEASPHPLRDRAEAAGKAGWKGLGIVHGDVLASIRHYGIPTIRRILEDNALVHNEVEVLTKWHRDDAKLAASNLMRDELLDFGAAIGARNLKITAGLFEEGPPDMPKFRDRFADLCERAAPYGIQVVVEFMPFSSVDTVDLALELVENGLANGGLMVDIWHVARRDQYDMVKTIPLSLLKGVELNDASANVAETLLYDSTHRRKLCGEGDLKIRSFIQDVLDIGYTGPWGVEIISDALRTMPLEEAARRVYETTMSQFSEIRQAGAA